MKSTSRSLLALTAWTALLALAVVSVVPNRPILELLYFSGRLPGNCVQSPALSNGKISDGKEEK